MGSNMLMFFALNSLLNRVNTGKMLIFGFFSSVLAMFSLYNQSKFPKNKTGN